MPNKYLEKIATVEISNREKAKEIKMRLYRDADFILLDNLESKLPKLNKSFEKTSKPFALNVGIRNPEYLKHISDGLSSDKDMHVEFKKTFDDHKKELEDLGDTTLKGLDSESYLNDHIKSHL